MTVCPSAFVVANVQGSTNVIPGTARTSSRIPSGSGGHSPVLGSNISVPRTRKSPCMVRRTQFLTSWMLFSTLLPMPTLMTTTTNSTPAVRLDRVR